jgi:hypothetical protein
VAASKIMKVTNSVSTDSMLSQHVLEEKENQDG